MPAMVSLLPLQSLERLPTLRRLTRDLEQDFDYLTRQAVLNLRKNGVYRVSGGEGKGKLAWVFEYVVDDRRSRKKGQALPGEKVPTDNAPSGARSLR